MGIARSTYYDRPQTSVDDTAIVEAMFAVCDDFEAYGYRRVGATLRLRREFGGDPMLPFKSVKERSAHEDNSVRPIKQDRGGNLVIYAAVGSAFSNSRSTQPGLYQASAPAKARRLMNCVEFHYVPKHGSWFNMLEDEIWRTAQSMPASPHRQQGTSRGSGK
jgi:hypothetical protein